MWPANEEGHAAAVAAAIARGGYRVRRYCRPAGRCRGYVIARVPAGAQLPLPVAPVLEVRGVRGGQGDVERGDGRER